METEESEDGAGGNDNRNVEGILNLKEEKKLKKGKRESVRENYLSLYIDR